jgi:urease accessory protein
MMYASALRSEAIAGAEPRRQRAQGRAELGVARLGPATRVTRVSEAGSLRLRMPRVPGSMLEAVLINTAGGIACGDRFAVGVDAGPGSELVLATPAAEKVYRSDGASADVSIRLTLAAGADLSWLPQETIVFDRARLRRRLDVDLAAAGRLLLADAIVFGRTARGEEVREALVEDRWRIRRDGRLVYADSLRLSGAVSDLLDRPAIGGGCRALGTVVYVAGDAEERLDEARSLFARSPCPAGASAWNGLLAVRFLARDGAELRRAAVPFLEGFRGCPLPRVWRT